MRAARARSIERRTVGWTTTGAAPPAKTVQETRTLETEVNEGSKEFNQWILVFVFLGLMTEQVCSGISGLLRLLR
jgi:hypothetical protein